MAKRNGHNVQVISITGAAREFGLTPRQVRYLAATYRLRRVDLRDGHDRRSSWYRRDEIEALIRLKHPDQAKAS